MSERPGGEAAGRSGQEEIMGVMCQTYRTAGAPGQGSFALDPEEG